MAEGTDGSEAPIDFEQLAAPCQFFPVGFDAAHDSPTLQPQSPLRR